MSPDVLWICRTDELERRAAEIPPGPLALDLEADSFHHYTAKVCLLQLGYRGRTVLVDPLGGADPAALGPVLGDRSIRKIVHGADYDLRLLHRDHEIEVRGLYDTMIAARLVGERAFGLAALLEAHLGVRLDKRHQRADWSERPLSPERLAYAAEDVRHLEPLAELLERRLEALGRAEWAREEFRRIEGFRFSMEPPDPEAYRKVKGAGELDGVGLAVLREVFRLRDDEARERDLPPFKVARDEALLEIARAAPGSPNDLQGIPHLSWKLRQGPGALALLAAVERARSIAPGELPSPVRPTRRRVDPAFEARVKRLQKGRDAVAAELGLDPSVVASRTILEELLRCIDAGRPPEAASGLRAWQAKLVVPVLASAQAV